MFLRFPALPSRARAGRALAVTFRGAHRAGPEQGPGLRRVVAEDERRVIAVPGPAGGGCGRRRRGAGPTTPSRASARDRIERTCADRGARRRPRGRARRRRTSRACRRASPSGRGRNHHGGRNRNDHPRAATTSSLARKRSVVSAGRAPTGGGRKSRARRCLRRGRGAKPPPLQRRRQR